MSAQYECLSGDSLVFGASGVVPLRTITAGNIVYSLDEQSKKLVKQKVLGIVHKGNKKRIQ